MCSDDEWQQIGATALRLVKRWKGATATSPIGGAGGALEASNRRASGAPVTARRMGIRKVPAPG